MKTRKITDSEKAKHPNMDYVIELSRGKEYFTEAAFFELFNEIADVVSKNNLLSVVSESVKLAHFHLLEYSKALIGDIVMPSKPEEMLKESILIETTAKNLIKHSL